MSHAEGQHWQAGQHGQRQDSDDGGSGRRGQAGKQRQLGAHSDSRATRADGEHDRAVRAHHQTSDRGRHRCGCARHENVRDAELGDRAFPGQDHQAAEARVGHGEQRQHQRHARILGLRRRDRGKNQQQGTTQRADAGQLQRGAAEQEGGQTARERQNAGDQTERPAGGRLPHPGALLTGRDRVDNVVENGLGGGFVALLQIEQLAIADLKLAQRALRIERRLPQPGQRPATVGFRLLGGVGAGVAQQSRQQMHQGHLHRQGQIDPHVGSHDGDPAHGIVDNTCHVRSPIDHSRRLIGALKTIYNGPFAQQASARSQGRIR